MINTSKQYNTSNQMGNPLPMMAFAYPELGKLAQGVAAANEGQLRLFIAGVNTDEVTFLSFDSDGHSLSSDYRFNFMLELTNVVDLSNVIGSAAYNENLLRAIVNENLVLTIQAFRQHSG